MNKTLKMWMLSAILILSGISMTSCGNKTAKQTETPAQSKAEVAEKVVGKPTCFTAVDDYLVNEIGENYSTDESNPNDILVWGDFWVFNYELSGDTLKTVSGGSHPGLMHVKKTDSRYEVTGFDAVVDGAGNLESAKKIFGDKFDVYQEFTGADEKREMERLRFTADYVKKHNLSAKVLQDYGWPAVELPQ